MTDPEIPLRRALRNFEDQTPPESPEPVKCDACEGTGKIGCVEACIQPPVDSPLYEAWEKWEPTCLAEHSCLLCKRTGWLTPSPEDWKDAKGETDMDRYCERD